MHTNGKQIVLKIAKRDYPTDQKCELCGEFSEALDYHHFDDSKLHIGIWVCSQNCHGLAETIDKYGLEMAQKYLNLKMRIQNI